MTPPSDDDFKDENVLPPDQEEDGKGKKGKGKAEGAGAAGLSSSTLSPGFLQAMAHFGASMEQITRIMKEWTHLRGDALLRTIMDFAQDIARASAQPLVAFDGDYGIITNFILHLRGQSARVPSSRPEAGGDARPGPR